MNHIGERKINVLVIDPDEEFAHDVKMFLEDTYCVNIKPTIDKLDYSNTLDHVNVIIIAIEFLSKDFINLIEQLRKKHENIKIISMYTYITSDKELEHKLIEYSDDIITKPFDVTLLKNKLDSFLISA
ncbi:MAG: response regulator [Calditrichaceae bacterium]